MSKSRNSIVIIAFLLVGLLAVYAVEKMPGVSHLDVKFGRDGGQVVVDASAGPVPMRQINVIGPYVSSLTNPVLARIRDRVNACGPESFDNVHGYYTQNPGAGGEYAVLVMCVTSKERKKTIQYDAYEIIAPHLDLQNFQRELTDRPDVVFLLAYEGGQNGIFFLAPVGTKIPEATILPR